jgi:hypothetical protein
MNEIENPSRRILVIANQPCPCPALADEVARRALPGPADVVVVAPALNSRLRHWASDVDAAVLQASQRVRAALDDLRDRGISARGTVGDSDPVMAIEDALADFPATEIMIATHPHAESHWLERGLIRKSAARFEAPVREVVSDS